MKAQEGLLYESPDDPYTIMTRWDDDGLHIVVSAHVLADGDDTAVRAEAQRRADVVRDFLLASMRRTGRA